MAQHPDTCSPASPVWQTWRLDNDCDHLPPITWLCRASVFLQSASGHSRFPALQCGTIFRLTSHQRHHSRFSDSASSRSCSLSLIRTFTADSQSLLLSLHLCGPSNNWHYLDHTKNDDDDDDDDDQNDLTSRMLGNISERDKHQVQLHCIIKTQRLTQVYSATVP